MAHASWCRRRAQYTDSSTMRGFLGYLSHECRVPLQVVLAGLEVLSGADGGSSLDGGEFIFYFFLFRYFYFHHMGNCSDDVFSRFRIHG